MKPRLKGWLFYSIGSFVALMWVGKRGNFLEFYRGRGIHCAHGPVHLSSENLTNSKLPMVAGLSSVKSVSSQDPSRWMHLSPSRLPLRILDTFFPLPRDPDSDLDLFIFPCTNCQNIFRPHQIGCHHQFPRPCQVSKSSPVTRATDSETETVCRS